MNAAANGAGRSASAWALHQILDLIRRGDVGAGRRLPAERELATSLGVSRGSVREAISALVTMGVLESRHGAGVFVTDLDPTTLLSSFGHVLGLVVDQHPEGVARLHAQIEASTAARAAARATPDGVAALAQALAELRLAIDEPRPRTQRDRFNRTIARLSEDRFHRAIARLADDPVAEGMLAVVRAARDVPGADPLVPDLAAHEELFEAIARREPDEARTLAAHLAAREFPVVTPEPRSAERPDGRPLTAPAAAAPGTTPDWFRDAKFGLMVHWGVYSIPAWAPPTEGGDDEAGSFAEWYQASASTPGTATAQYHARVHGGRPYQAFRPAFESAVATWSAEAWAAEFAASGARYVVQVAKHHDGYLLWPSRVRHPRDQAWRSERDVVGELAAAVRTRGMRFGVSYSSGMDWSFGDAAPAHPADVRTSRPPGTDYARYVEAHWRELIAQYQPDGLWNDTGYPTDGDARRIIEEYRLRVPDGVVTGRFRTSAAAPGGPWESVRPIGLSFGWNREEAAEHVTAGPDLVRLLLDVVARNGNLLLGVSPDDRGRLPDAQATSLRHLGRWLASFGPAVYASRPWGPGTSTTRNGGSVWYTRHPDALNVFVEHEGGETEILGLDLTGVDQVRDLVHGTPVEFRPTRRGTTFLLTGPPDDRSPVGVLRLSPAPDPTVTPIS